MTQAFEVEVEIRHESFYSYRWKEKCYRASKEMYQFFCRTPKQARELGQQHGRVLSVRKVARIEGAIELLPLNQAPLPPPLYNNAIAMDEMIWQKRKAVGRELRENNLMYDHP